MSLPLYMNSRSSENIIADVSPSGSSQHCCYDQREPSYNTVIYPGTVQGFLPAGSYGFTANGSVISSCTGTPIPTNSLYARTAGPIIGATMGSCVPRAVSSSIIDKTGLFNVLPSTMARKCFS